MSDILINSAALYFRASDPKKLPSIWLSKALEFLSAQGLTPHYFDIAGYEALSAEETWELPRHKEVLLTAVRVGTVDSIGLYYNPEPRAPRSAWQAMVSVETGFGSCFLRVDA